ncbi:membrane-associated protein, putative [Bodo saltans]|uniref:Membrane-associated protein, putative n=1 Tax=Bodo saltans TaxID=75058 RepID=A0A0S4JQU7_BODSA|nr:membrane-associated protein, putative [Bodo saltans]|eukprot:CUG92586.1 membrane-associated protein, putative [Bodo saltans]
MPPSQVPWARNYMYFLACICCCCCASSGSSYFAASVMHFPLNLTSNISIAEKIRLNLAAYDQHVANAAAQNAQIIVFPESGTGYLAGGDSEIRSWCEPMPAPGWRAVDCSNASTTTPPAFRHMQHAYWASCAAQTYKIDIVLNFGYHQTTTNEYFNSDVAFNQYGFLLAIYLKSHINARPYLTQPAKPDPVTFVSSFGVQFGMFTCYDMWFHDPMDEEIRLLNVTDFVYPNGMGSMAPLMTIDQVHAGWSLTHDVNLVSAALFPTGGAGAFHRGNALGMNAYQPYVNAVYSVTVTEVPMITNSDGRMKDHRSKKLAQPSNVKTPVLSESQSSSSGSHASCFGGMASCDVFQPAPNSTFYLSASFQGAFALVSCTATVTTASNSSHVWMLAAGQVDMVPQSNGTLDANEVAFCLIVHCDDPQANCDLGAPVPAYWTSDLLVTNVAVEGEVSGGMNRSSKITFFPMYAFLNTTAVSSDTPFPQVMATTASVTAGVSPATSQTNDTVAYFLTITPNDDVVTENPVYSVGLYLTAKG